MVLKNFYYKMIKKLNKILYGIGKFEKKTKKKTTQDVLHLINEFGKLHNLKEEVRVHFGDDQLQKTETNTCRVFQLFFFVNLFNPDENSVLIEDKILTKKKQ